MARSQREVTPHHFGVTMFNLACFSLVQDRLADALEEVEEAIDALEPTSDSIELVAAITLRASIHARQGEADRADEAVAELLARPGERIESEALINAADFTDSFGSSRKALALLDSMSSLNLAPVEQGLSSLVWTRLLTRQWNFVAAAGYLTAYPSGRPTGAAATSARLTTEAYLSCARGDQRAVDLATLASGHAARQRAHSWRRLAELIKACAVGPASLDEAVLTIGARNPWHLTFLADLLVPRLGWLSDASRAAVERAAHAHPQRWRSDLRRMLDSEPRDGRASAARLLESIGEREDVRRLRAVARSEGRGGPGASIGRGLARRLASPVFVEDQGRIMLRIGSRVVSGSEVRRKVLALLCFLLSRPGRSSTREQVLEALWPDLRPDLAQNSLNQTLYFLRRVFEEDYVEDLSPGYVRLDSDVIWLDGDLVTSRSLQCWELLRSFSSRPSPDQVEQLVELYDGRYALDFEYEEWAGSYRDSLHASYLEIVERSVLDDLHSGHFDRGIRVARRALEVDPSADQVEVSLLRLYRATSAHSAAAEQYSHYASVLREELGEEPPPLDSL
jgi:DNA-binding SARP family transcriptional activator